ncbi:hypothetical protein H1Z61_07130 [Bacillus aquiflavi]|uniref:Glucose-1-phosphate thymidylyltransferase n=1 Tax=Bacillus aquiflavi TaxID=2672567 RepID=A0A6B3W319_9BACI|nr:sugar phosphate nucleotidyltransferase [Bacillus aquiflavi]MBA4536920.1 hypothetical protein [Bacillus aquiflavi]NEY82306.1 hypothetical protein [Bacillus aquiflavi]UAC47735.1 hypothetical protein K6959_14075 [Bacillus aquiflavi]
MKQFGIIPAAGLGTRLAPLPFSKEMYPIGYQSYNEELRPCPVSQYLVKSLKMAETDEVFFIINQSKTDIMSYYLNGQQFNMNFSYLIQTEPKGMVDALVKVSPWLPKEEYVITFGMPDTLFKPDSLFRQLVKKIKQKQNIDLILGVFPTEAWFKLGMTTVQKGKDGELEVIKIIDKPKIKPDTDYAWGIAVWKSKFQHFLTNYHHNYSEKAELVLGDVFSAALKEGFKVCALKGELFLDIGTLEDLTKAIKYMDIGGG